MSTERAESKKLINFPQDGGPANSQDDYDAKLQAAIKAAKLNGSARKRGK